MWLCEGWPLPFSASHPHPRVSHSAQAWLGGSLELFCSGGFLGEIVKAVTVWAFISPEKRRGRKDRGKGQEGDGGEYQRRVWTQTALLTSTRRGWEGERKMKKAKKKREWIEQKAKKKTISSVTSPLLFPSFFSSSSLFLDSSLSAPSIWPYVSSLFSSITSFCPPPHPSSPAPRPPPLLYTHSIIGETRLREMSGVGAIIITTSFRYTWVIAHRIENRHLNHNQ